MFRSTIPLCSGSRRGSTTTSQPSSPRSSANCRDSAGGRPNPRNFPTPPSLSHTSCPGTPPSSCSSRHVPSTRSSACRDGIISPSIHREYPDAITSTGGTSSPAATFPWPSGIRAGGNQKSSCTRPPGSYAVRPAGSAGRYSGRSSPTRSRSTVIDRSHPIRSATTVAGIVGHSASCSRIAGSASSTIEPFGAR